MADPRHNAHHALTYPVSGYPSRPILRPTLPLHPIALSVSTSTVASELDPNEQTARPGNAHNHRLFLDGLSAPASAPAPAPAKPDPGATPVDARPPAVALSRPFSSEEEERLAHLDSFKFFLATAPSQWSGGRPPSLSFAVGSSSGWTTPPDGHTHAAHLSLNRFLLPSQEFVTCIFWNGLYHITGTDIVRALVFRFEAFGRPVQNMKKFEEGVFSDLRNLKPGYDASLEEPKSPFLDLLFKYQCIRTQKKQKVFYWYSVPHDRLFLDALDRDLKREKMGHPPTTHVVGEPALSFTYDPKRTLYDQYAKKSTATELESDQDADLSESDTDSLVGATGIDNLHIDAEDSEMSDPDHLQRSHYKSYGNNNSSNSSNSNVTSFFSNLFGIFEGSPTYKQRRKKGHAQSSLSRSVSRSSSVSSPHIRPDDLVDRGRSRNIASGYHHPGASLSRERSQPYPSPYSHIHRQHSLPHLPPTDAPFHYDEIPTDTTPLFHQQATGDLMPIDRYTRKSLPDVNPIISHGFTAQQQTLQQSNPFSVEDSSIGYDTFPAVSSHSSPGLHYDIDHKHRAHTCPLISCNKLFKRTEHLKRHLRTHTLEKPFICPVCHKHFSRRDNLNQHIKIHDRSDGTIVGLLKGDGAQEMEGLDDPINTMSTGPEMNTLGALSGLNPATVGMWREGSEDSDLSGAESEGFADDGIGFFDQRQQHVMDVNAGNTAATATADPMFIGVGASNVGGASGMSGGLGDIQMEDEIPRGSEEEMMQPHAHTLQYAAVTQNFAPDSVLWAQQSPAFPSPSQQQHARHTSRSSMPGSPVGMIARHNHSSSSSTSSLSAFGNGTGSGDEFGTSMSLPLYERPGMYTSGVVAETGNATGAGAGSSTRRPRSMTPSLFGRGVEESGIRRPLSSVSSLNESGVNGNRSRGESGGGSERPSPVPMISSMNMAGGQRVYHHQHQHHPYVNSGSRGGSSTHSSPAVYNVSLGNVHSAGGESVQQPTHPSHQHQHQHQHQQQQQQDGIQGGGGGGGSESRTSFNDEQEMFGISQQHPMTTYHQHSHHSHHHHHQQQQPLTESPLPYTIELPQQQQQHWNPHHHHHHHHHHRDVMNMVGAYDSSQQQQ